MFAVTAAMPLSGNSGHCDDGNCDSTACHYGRRTEKDEGAGNWDEARIVEHSTSGTFVVLY